MKIEGLIETKKFGPHDEIKAMYFKDGEQSIQYPTGLTEYKNIVLIRDTLFKIANRDNTVLEVVGYYDNPTVIEDYFDKQRARMGSSGTIRLNADVGDKAMSVLITKTDEGLRENEILFRVEDAQVIAEPILKATISQEFVELVPQMISQTESTN